MIRRLLILLSITTDVWAEAPLEDYGPLQGRYEIVGRKPDSKAAYTGIVELRATSTGLRVERRVDGRTAAGTAQFELKTPDKIQVLTIKIEEDEVPFEYSCRIGWDLDNYARLTCLYGIIDKTRVPGIEALFIQRRE